MVTTPLGLQATPQEFQSAPVVASVDQLAETATRLASNEEVSVTGYAAEINVRGGDGTPESHPISCFTLH